mgnify:CR=1 FL=1
MHFMKNKLIYLLSFLAIGLGSCSTKFMEEMKPYDKYDESIFTNEIQTGWYIDRLYNYFFVTYRNPNLSVVGLYNDTRWRSTDEIGGTVTDLINPTKTLQLASEGDAYFGTPVGTSVQNNPYTRIRFCNFLLEKIDGIGQALPETFRKTAKGQMYFMRALQYFDLVRIYGGVPLVLTVQNASTTDEEIKLPRATPAECFEQIVKDLDSAANLLPMQWDAANYGRLTGAGAIAMKSRVLLTFASPLFNADWDNPANDRWQKALQASLEAETALTQAGYGLYGTTARQWAEMTTQSESVFNPEAIMVQRLSNTTTTSAGINNAWENMIRPKDHNGSGNGLSVPKDMIDLFPLADGKRPTPDNGYVDTFFFENRDPRFYRTFAFSGLKWPAAGKPNKTSWFYRYRNQQNNNWNYSGNNQTISPVVVKKMTNPSADTTQLQFSGTDIFEYRYAELLLNIAEAYAATGDINKCLTYLGKIRQRVGIPSTDNYGIGNLADRYAALEAVLYERRVELAYEGKRFWDLQRWMLYGDDPAAGNNTNMKLGIAPLNGTARTGYYWQAKDLTPGLDPLTPAEKNLVIDPDDPATFETRLAQLKQIVQDKFEVTPLDQEMDRVNNTPVTMNFRQNYYIWGITSSVLLTNPWLQQTVGWMDAGGSAGTFQYR